jgi:hypothetical protein
VKDILDEIRTENMALIPHEKWQRGREEKHVSRDGGLRGFEN